MQQLGLSKIFAVSLTVLAMTGCASKGGATDEAATTETTAAEESQTQPVPASPGVDVETRALSLKKKKIFFFFFFFVRAQIRPEFKEILNAHAEYLKANPQARIVLEGHCDERGTVEYNLALGERRANTTKRYLIVQGVSANQIETVSYGEERPAQIGSTEAAWAKNRRSEITYQAQ